MNKERKDNHLAPTPKHKDHMVSIGVCWLAGFMMVNHLVKVSCSECDRNVMINKFFC